jgi:rod shape-determining protein MreC
MPGKNFRLLLLLLIISVLILSLGEFLWFSKVESLIKQPFTYSREKVFNVFQSARDWSANIKWQFATISYQQKLSGLEGQLRQLAVNENKLSVCLEENSQLKKLLGTPLPPEWKFVMAKIISAGERVTVDKGRRDGVKEGMNAVSENVLVGRVVAVNETTSQIQLLSSAALKIPVVVKAPVARNSKQPSIGATARGILRGEGDGKLSLDKVLQEESIQEGDLVVSVNQAGWLADLVIGQITEVQTSSAEIWRKAKVMPLINYQELKYLFLVVP